MLLDRQQMAYPNRNGYSRNGRNDTDFGADKGWDPRRRDDKHREPVGDDHDLRRTIPGDTNMGGLALEQCIAIGQPLAPSSNENSQDQPRRGMSAPPASRRPSPIPELPRTCGPIAGSIESTQEPILDTLYSDKHQGKPNATLYEL